MAPRLSGFTCLVAAPALLPLPRFDFARWEPAADGLAALVARFEVVRVESLAAKPLIAAPSRARLVADRASGLTAAGFFDTAAARLAPPAVSPSSTSHPSATASKADAKLQRAGSISDESGSRPPVSSPVSESTTGLTAESVAGDAAGFNSSSSLPRLSSRRLALSCRRSASRVARVRGVSPSPPPPAFSPYHGSPTSGRLGTRSLSSFSAC